MEKRKNDYIAQVNKSVSRNDIDLQWMILRWREINISTRINWINSLKNEKGPIERPVNRKSCK